VGHLPHGFNEKELKGFFEQFGEVSRLRVSRSKKTARSKGYAFIEFKGDGVGESKKIAEVAAKAMHNYMAFGRQLSVHTVEEAHRDLFKHGNREWTFVPT
jgi:nucleolar protein 15